MDHSLKVASLVLVLGLVAEAQPPIPGQKKAAGGANPSRRAPDGMPLTGLSPAKLIPHLCVYSYPVSSQSADCRAYCDQGFGYYYSYVWMEAARCFETALRHDPECAYAWLYLARSLEKWGKGLNPPPSGPFAAAIGGVLFGHLPEPLKKSAVEMAWEKAKQYHALSGQREQLLIQAALQEKGLWPNTPPEERKKKAQATLDELLILHEDDEEGWFWRGQMADNANARVPFYKALLKINPLHPGASHELVHFYENFRRPALGWPYAEVYMKSSPGLPHAFHMQAHLAMRIGKWQQTTDWSAKAIELQRDYHKLYNVRPAEDHQFSHHLETLTRSLIHDGRFAEAKRIKSEAIGHGYQYRPEWIRMAITEKDWAEAGRLIDAWRRTDKANAAYFGALVALEQGEPQRAAAEIDTLREQIKVRRTDKTLELKLWEIQGRYECQAGQAETGLKLLKRLVDRTKDDYRHHAWGNGAVYMETWGISALEAGDAASAAEAFQEALAHDSGSVRGALGMWAISERLGQVKQAERYLKLARRCWERADERDFQRLQRDYADKASRLPVASLATEGQ